MSNELAVPEYLKQYVGQQVSDTDAMAMASVSVPRISLRGRTFRFIEGGEEKTKTPGPIEVIILGVEPGPGLFNKTFYAGTYSGGESAPPDCASDDGVKPAVWVSKPQHHECATCPKNAFGSATSRTGKQAKACRDSKRLWVVKKEDPTGIMYGLQTPVTSLKSLAEYGRKLKSHNVPLSLSITRISMVDAEYPQLEFTCAGFVSQDGAVNVMERAQKREWSLFASSASRALAAPEAASPLSLPGAVQADPLANPPAHVTAAVQQVQPQPNTPVNIDNVLDQW